MKSCSKILYHHNSRQSAIVEMELTFTKVRSAGSQKFDQFDVQCVAQVQTQAVHNLDVAL